MRDWIVLVGVPPAVPSQVSQTAGGQPTKTPVVRTLMLTVAMCCLLALFSGCSSNGCGCPDQLFSFGALHPAQAAEVIADNEGFEKFTMMDVRSPAEFATGHLAGARNIDFNGNFASELATLNPEGVYLVYCGVGGRSSQAVAMMEDLGFEHLFELWGGVDNWVAQGYPVE